MADYYADSSVLVKRHVNETGAAWFRALCSPEAGNTIITARISMAEVYSLAANARRRLSQTTMLTLLLILMPPAQPNTNWSS